MAKITYSSLKLKTNTEVNTFIFNEKTIEVLKYLPISDKYELIMAVVNASKPDGYFNDIIMDMAFHLQLVFHYSNITFTEKQKEDITKLYDALNSSGFLNKFIEAMDEEEYNEVWNSMLKVASASERYTQSLESVVKNALDDLPTKMEKAKEIMDTFDLNNYEQLQNVADTFGMNNAIKNASE